ncbi:hypothetical protein [Neorhizobium sp. NCHU2750]|uniref:hypothetical protein n=1 Tax=Neorhizobium sp. NCHU2750 TaxID=1825976 RepID=UPI000EB71848|nr:hypothetical protein NCHU2750_08250 [Neorhizobium sp. NCHU2750]
MPSAQPDQFDRFDPALFGLWQDRPRYEADFQMEDGELIGEVRTVLEVKSADALPSPADQLRQILNDMTVEMREQFSTFRKMRESAAAALTDGDEAAQKLARADVKAATDAMSLIVRTLEKVDSLQRQLARDREIEAERLADEGGYEEAVREVDGLIWQRAQEMFEKRCVALGIDPGKRCSEGGDQPQPTDTG